MLATHAAQHSACARSFGRSAVVGRRRCIAFNRHAASASLRRDAKALRQAVATTQLDRPLSIDSQIKEATDVLKESVEEKYVWTKQWYPVRVEEDLHTDRPNAVKVLGKSLVIWKDGDSQWRCFDDVCPHRFAMLSEGRVEADGTLQCAYHGWRFNGEGKCTTVPQTASQDQLAKATANKKSCTTTYPVQVQHRLVWVWPDAAPTNQLEAMSQKPPVAEELLEEDNSVYLHPWFMRELPYGFDVLLENLVDPSHVPFTHSGVIGDRNDAAVSHMTLNKKLSTHGGFVTDIDEIKGGASSLVTKDGGNTKSRLSFVPPTLTRYDFSSDGMALILLSYCTPVSQGRSRIFYCLAGRKETLPKNLQRIFALIPPWLKFVNHFDRNAVLDGDSIFLHAQDKMVNTQGYSHEGYYTPTSNDLAVRSMRQWLSSMTEPVPWPSSLKPDFWSRDAPREELLDRYHQHTVHCKNCSQALEAFTWARNIAVVSAVALTAMFGSAALAGAPQRPVALGLLAAAATSGAAAVQFSKTRQKFLFEDYIQQEH